MAHGIQYSMQAAGEISLHVIESSRGGLSSQRYLYATYDRFLYKIDVVRLRAEVFDAARVCCQSTSDAAKDLIFLTWPVSYGRHFR
jgi:hypothetical protein